MKWGILATGTIAAKFADTVNQMEAGGEEHSLRACGSRSLERAEAFAGRFHIPAAYDSYEALVQDDEVEAVYIATPNHLHYENCRLCLEQGKHVLCEKPFTINEAQARELFELAEEKGLFIMEAFWIRHLPALKKLQALIKEGAIGEVSFARSDYGFVAAGARKDRKFDSGLGGGALLDIGVYNLGFMHMVMGDEAPEHFTSAFHINEYGTDDYSSILLSYPGGRTACVTASIGTVMPREAVIYGSKGRIRLEDFQHAERLVLEPSEGEPEIFELPFDINGFEYQIRETARCAALGMTSSDVLKKEDTLTILKLMDEIRQSWGLVFRCET